MEKNFEQLALDFEVGQAIRNLLEKIDTQTSSGDRFVGKVISNNDPNFSGKLQVFIYGIHPKELESDTDTLPWVMPLEASDFKGGFALPLKGDLVNIEFDNNDINFPRWTTKAYVKKTLPSVFLQQKNVDLVVLFEHLGNYATWDRRTGEFFVKLNQVEINIDKSGGILIDNHLAVPATELLELLPESTKEITQEALAEAESKLALGAPIRLRSSGQVKIEAPEIVMGGETSQALSYVKPGLNPLGSGGLNCIPICPFTLMIHQGNKVSNFYSTALETLNDATKSDSDQT
jgi:hypothetical protein